MADGSFRLARIRGQLVRVPVGATSEEIEAALAAREARAAATAAAAAALPSAFARDDSRPLLLIDVDGVVCPYAGDLVDPAAAGLEQSLVGYSRVWLARDIAEHLQRLGELFQLVWCTAWEDHAAEFLAPFLGLPAMPVIHFDEPAEEDGHWKWPAIETFVGSSAAASRMSASRCRAARASSTSRCAPSSWCSPASGPSDPAAPPGSCAAPREPPVSGGACSRERAGARLGAARC